MERAVEDHQPIEVTVDAIMELVGLQVGSLHVGEPFIGRSPADCPAASEDGYFCCLPRTHDGVHAASNGTIAVAVWRD